MQEISTLADQLSQRGIFGVIAGLILLLGAFLWVIWRVISNNEKTMIRLYEENTKQHREQSTAIFAALDASGEIIKENIKASQQVSATLNDFKQFITSIVIRERL